MGLPRAGLYGLLPTEQPNPATRRIDRDPLATVVAKINRQDRLVAPAVARESRRLVRAVEIFSSALRGGGRALFVGAGTSGRLGVLEAAECPPTFGTPPGLVRAVMAGGRACVFRSTEGAEDDPAAGARAVRRLSRRGDVVVGIAASGVTPFVRGALRSARRLGCRTILVTSNRRPAIPEADVVVSPSVGPEVLSGSTRLKSGTAAKLVLNTLTTASMIALGKVYDHWLVDLRPTSRKLRLRGVRIVCELGRVGPARARELLARCGWSVKIGVAAARLGLAPDEARRRLARAGGNLRTVLEETP